MTHRVRAYHVAILAINAVFWGVGLYALAKP